MTARSHTRRRRREKRREDNRRRAAAARYGTTPAPKPADDEAPRRDR